MNLRKFLFNKQMIYSLFIGIVGTVVLTSCDDSDDETAGQEITFNDYSPTVGGQGTLLTLTGENFGAKITDVSVWINDKEVDVFNVTQTQINGRVPAGAGSGPVKVAIGNREYTYPTPFEYLVDYVVSTYAGNGEAGYVDGPVADARFEKLFWLAYDSKEDVVYTLETDVNPARIRRIKNGEVETVVNFGEPQPINVNNPRTIEFSVTGDTIFISNDAGTAAGNIAVAVLTRDDDFKVLKAHITYPNAITQNLNFAGVHPIDGTLFYYCYSGKIYMWDKETTTATLLADVTSALGRGDSYCSLRFSPDGETLYLIGKYDYQGILSAGYDRTTKTLTRDFSAFAGTGTWGANDGIGTTAGMDQPCQGVFGSDGNLYTVERYNHVVRRITPEAQVITFIGTLGSGSGYVNGDASEAKFFEPNGITFDKNDNMYVADQLNNRIRLIQKAE